jgi:dUTP pyrophosphatase
LIAQLLIQPVERAEFVEADELAPSDRGAAGHGSTGGVAEWRSVVLDEPALGSDAL